MVKVYSNEEIFHPPKITIHQPKGTLMNEVNTELAKDGVSTNAPRPETHGEKVREVAKENKGHETKPAA